MLKIDLWDTPDRAKKEFLQRLSNCRTARKRQENYMTDAERIIFETNSDSADNQVVFRPDGTGQEAAEDFPYSINLAFKNYRFLHSQLASNPPAVQARPTSPDTEDKRRADAAQRLIRYCMRQYMLPERKDKLCGHALLWGTGIIKHYWDANAGEPLDFDAETGKITMEGDLAITNPSMWNIYLDPNAVDAHSCEYIIEKLIYPYDTACAIWPEYQGAFQKVRSKEGKETEKEDNEANVRPEFLRKKLYDVIEIYQYWETGKLANGFQGRLGHFLVDGTAIGEVVPNPHRFKRKKDDALEVAFLPYTLLTDIDNPEGAYGRSAVLYQAPLQDAYNDILSSTLTNIKAHGVARLVLNNDQKIADDSITNSPWDIIRVEGPGTPTFVPPMQLPQAMDGMMAYIANGINDMAGTNESMFGQQSREQSGFMMQYATNQGNMIRVRLFNKYTLAVESMYKNILRILTKHWTTPKTINVLGNENAFEAVEINAVDLVSGFDIVVEYGTSLPLDPISRRQELLTLAPLIKEAGVPSAKILKALKMSDLEGPTDRLELADNRAQEYIDRIIASGEVIPPRPIEEHKAMLDYMYTYAMTAQYRDLPVNLKDAIDAHIKLREQFAAQPMQPGAPAVQPGNGPLPAPGDLAPTAGSTGAVPDATQMNPALVAKG